LHREIPEDDTYITQRHQLLRINGKRVEEVVIPGDTPCVAVAVDESCISVQFDETSDALLFCAPLPGEEWAGTAGQFEFKDEAHGGYFVATKNPATGKPHDRFYLLGTEWTIAGSGDACTGSIQFEHHLFDAIGSSCRAYLMIDKGSLSRTEDKRRVLTGKVLQ
jgi:hypothetical protein